MLHLFYIDYFSMKESNPKSKHDHFLELFITIMKRQFYNFYNAYFFSQFQW